MLTQDLEQIYELTYKYQILSQEAKRGDWGSPQVLNDSAQMALLKISDSLRRYLLSACKQMVEAFEEWVTEHESVVMTDVTTDIESLLEEGDEQLRSELSGVPVEQVRHMSVQEILTEMQQNGTLDDIVDSSPLMRKVHDAMVLWDRLRSPSNDLNQLILTFQEALHYAHFNGLFAEEFRFIEDMERRSVNSFLKYLSNLPASVIGKWDKDLARVLGYEPGSRLVLSWLRLAVWYINGRDRSLSKHR